MICKQCGENLTKYERFCPCCGSYFIAADDETDGRMWKGVITENGMLSEAVVASEIAPDISKSTAAVNSSRTRRSAKHKELTSDSRKVWSIIGFAAAAFVFFCNIICNYITGYDIEFFGFVIFPLAVVGAILGFKKLLGKFAWLVIIADVVLFFN